MFHKNFLMLVNSITYLLVPYIFIYNFIYNLKNLINFYYDLLKKYNNIVYISTK